MPDRSTPNHAAFLSDVVRETEWYADQALEMASCHRRASDAYGNVHMLFGLPAAILASISGISAFTQNSIIAGITAFIVAGITGAMSFLNPAEKEKLHFEAGNVLDAWATKTYLLIKQGRANLIEPSDVISQWEKLMEERSQLLRQSPRIPTWAMSKAMKRFLDPFNSSK
ncbi:hypothetical protein C7B65_26560 [Phormidesmis priestleyi ULC007]|uniref:SLATT domain-containing protein n=1 Tax=Phormidesmis priestleyi ULC007 TaxID=1920490 RepID=A0A2T1D1K6_9CYAN|nr:SLATT domain-containing protein [Phormidesmis priestleyi]PSB14350.1 hypothetical protein C7B65_26560 [Phormidesmis priestleyi ULC007]